MALNAIHLVLTGGVHSLSIAQLDQWIGELKVRAKSFTIDIRGTKEEIEQAAIYFALLNAYLKTGASIQDAIGLLNSIIKVTEYKEN